MLTSVEKANIYTHLGIFSRTFEEDKFAIRSLVGSVDARWQALPELIDLHGITFLHLVVPQTPKPPVLQHNESLVRNSVSLETSKTYNNFRNYSSSYIIKLTSKWWESFTELQFSLQLKVSHFHMWGRSGDYKAMCVFCFINLSRCGSGRLKSAISISIPLCAPLIRPVNEKSSKEEAQF